jgi:uncharacterized RDD family membrane protein YckC
LLHQPANIYKRILAVIIDHLLVNYLLFLIATKFFGLDPANLSLSWSLFLIFSLINFAYFFLLEAVFAKTLGKKIFNLEVRTTQGERLTLAGAFWRNLLRPIDFIGFYFVGIIFIASTDLSQRLGDLAAHTYVAESW